MSSKRAKKHHFVPQVLQRQFLNEDGKIWYAEKGSESQFQVPEERNTQSAFKVRNLYTVMDDDQPSDVVEQKFYGPIDNYFGQLLAEMNKAFDEGHIPDFHWEALYSVRLLVYETLKRTPEFLKEHDDTDAGRTYVQSMLNDRSRQLSPRQEILLRNELKDPQLLKSYGRDIRVRGMIRRSEKVEAALEDFQIRWAISDTRHSFILSSMIAFRIGNGGANGLINPNVEIWMPVHPKRALVLIRDPNNKVPLVSSEPALHLRQINEYAAKHSQSIGSHSQRLIQSLTGKQVK